MSDHDIQLEPRQVPRQLLLLAGPIIASFISRTAMSFVDFAMVSQLPNSTEAQAAITPANMTVWILMGFGVSVVFATNTMVSQSLGRRQLKECSAYAWQGVYFGLALGVVSLPTWWLMPPIFRAMNHESAVQAMEITYAQIILLSTGPSVMGAAMTHFWNGVHRPTVTVAAAVLSNGLNIAANYALMFGHWGFEAMGITGAAWGTVLASAFNLVILLGWMLLPKYNALYGGRQTWRLSPIRLWRMLRVGLPTGAHGMVEVTAWMIFTTVLIGRFGKEQLAANNMCFRFLELSFMPALGLGVATSVMAGKAIGARRMDIARLVVRWGMGFGLVYVSIITAAFITLRYQMIGLLSDDPEVIKWAVRILLLCAMFQWFDVMTIIYSAALRSAGDTLWPAIVFTALTLTLFVGGGFVIVALVPQWGVIGPWIVALVYLVALAFMFGSRWWAGKWVRIDVFRGQDQAGGTTT